MGKPTGFMEFPRRKTPWRDINERLLDYYEIYTPAKDHDLQTQGARYMNCGVPFWEFLNSGWLSHLNRLVYQFFCRGVRTQSLFLRYALVVL